jgi:hypothetical protein
VPQKPSRQLIKMATFVSAGWPIAGEWIRRRCVTQVFNTSVKLSGMRLDDTIGDPIGDATTCSQPLARAARTPGGLSPGRDI